MADEPRCGNCGHRRHEHRPVLCWSRPDSLGVQHGYGTYGRCDHYESRDGEGYREFQCRCPGYVSDSFPHVSALIGHDVRREIERLVGADPRRRPLDPFSYAEGDVVVVSYGDKRVSHRVVGVVQDSVVMEPIE